MGPGTESSHVKVGQRVGIKWVASTCDNCPACLSGHDGVCFNQSISGYYHPGTFQQYVCGPARYVTPIPDSLDSAAAAPMWVNRSEMLLVSTLTQGPGFVQVSQYTQHSERVVPEVEIGWSSWVQVVVLAILHVKQPPGAWECGSSVLTTQARKSWY